MMRFLARLFASGASADRGATATANKVRTPKKTAGSRPKPGAPRAAADGTSSAADDDEHFDPYNTGVFDRGAPWESVRKRK